MGLSDSAFVELILRSRGFYFLILTVLVIFFSTLLLAGYTIFLRFANRLKGLKWQRLESKWEAVLLDVLSGTREPTVLWHLVGEKERLYFVDYLQRYAQRLRGEQRDRLCELASSFLEPIIEHIRTGDAERRARSVQTISLLGPHRYGRYVVAALDDPSPLVAMIAARYLMLPEHPEYAGEVLRRLHRFKTWSRNLLSSMIACVQ